jgi:hypothetical protein
MAFDDAVFAQPPTHFLLAADVPNARALGKNSFTISQSGILESHVTRIKRSKY